jgi:hypothetical protein
MSDIFKVTPKLQFLSPQKCQFRPTPMGRALYQCISLLPPLAGHSLEELRFAFAYGQPSKERVRLSRAEGSANRKGNRKFT